MVFGLHIQINKSRDPHQKGLKSTESLRSEHGFAVFEDSYPWVQVHHLGTSRENDSSSFSSAAFAQLVNYSLCTLMTYKHIQIEKVKIRCLFGRRCTQHGISGKSFRIRNSSSIAGGIVSEEGILSFPIRRFSVLLTFVRFRIKISQPWDLALLVGSGRSAHGLKTAGEAGQEPQCADHV